MCQHRHFRMFKFMTPIESNYLSVSDQSKLLLFSGEKNKEKKKEKTKEREPIGTNFLSDLKMKSIVIGHYHYQTFDYWGLWGYNFYDFFFFFWHAGLPFAIPLKKFHLLFYFSLITLRN